MADVMSCRSQAQEAKENGILVPESQAMNGSSELRRIKFHLARKPFHGLAKANNGDFRLETLNPTTPSEPSRAGCTAGLINGKKLDAPEFFDNWLDPDLSFEIKVRSIGAGLQNLGNTCFLNSVLQCLTYTEPLAAYLQSGKHQMSCRIAGFCALCSIQKHVSCALQSTGRILAPKDLVSNLRCISRSFRNARQEDAHEYMVNLLESMHKCCLPTGVSSDSTSAYEKSLVHKIFGGRLRSQVKCMQCSYCSNKFDPFLDLSLEITKAESLDKALKHFTAKEQLDGGERQYQCQRCRQKVKASKQLTVDKAPYVLSIHLKRFAAHNPGQKIDKRVQFSPVLDLKPFVSDSNEGELKYTLYGVLVHAGWSTHSGHYYCYVRTSNGIWYSLDDNRVYAVSERIVLEQKAYMLFYVRDGKTISSRKNVNNFRPDFMGNRTCSPSIQGLIQTPQNGLLAKKSDGTMASASTILNNGSSKDSIPKQALVQDLCTPALVSSCYMKREPLLEGTLVTEEPVRKSNGMVLRDSADNRDLPSNLTDERVTLMKQAPVDGLQTGDSSSTKREFALGVPLVQQNETLLKQVSANTSNRLAVGDSVVKMEPGLRVPLAVNRNFNGCDGAQNADSEKPLPDKTSELVVCSVNESAAMVATSGKKTSGSSQKLVLVEPGKSSSQVVMGNGSLDVKSCGHKMRKKSKKKLLKYGASSMHLSSMIFLRASLAFKKKQRMSKHRSGDTEKLRDTGSTDLGPSTSERSTKNSLRLKHSQRKRSKSKAKRASGKVELKTCVSIQTDCTDDELREANGQSSAILSSDKAIQKSTCLAMDSNQQETCATEILEGGRSLSMQTSLINRLTRAQEDSFVARWDETELPPSQIFESSPAEGTTIGYVLDDWDEEYDRGKRKKVRQLQRDFGGPNLFQQIASQKPQQFKKPRFDRGGSNQPFRI